MNNIERLLIGRYYVRLKNVHINWTHNTGPKRSEEAYIPIPAEYAYAYNIKKGEVYYCYYSGSDETVLLRAAGSQSRREFAKQFEGSNTLRVLYDWYAKHGAVEGDWVVVSIYDGNNIYVEYVSQKNIERISTLNLCGEKGRPEDITTIHSVDHTGFRLISLLVKANDSIICDYHFLPDNHTDVNNEPFTTLIIGANSTGKSFAMKILSEVFQAAISGSITKSTQFEYCRLKYCLDNDYIEIEIKGRAIIIHRNNVLVEKSFQEVLPHKVLAVAFMLNDKFAYKAESQDDSSIYEYLGLRKTSNAAWINTFCTRVAECFLELAATDRLWPIIHALSTHFDLEPKISIAYELSQRPLSLNQIKATSVSDLAKDIENLAQSIASKENYRKNAIARLCTEDYIKMATYLKGLESYDPFITNSKKLIFGHTFSESTSQKQMQEILSDYTIIQNLRNLKIIRDITLYVYRFGQKYSFDECSSGEKHILFAFLNIARHIRDNSLILIDEPEISLHPNWQMIYITALKQLFRDYPSCHFVIASHSPYLVSDLNPESSSLIVLGMDNGIRSASTLDYSTYAWSTENILYNVFHVRTTRNYYFDIELRELLHYTSHNFVERLPRIKELYSKLSTYVYDPKDPLTLILDEVKEYIANAES